MNLDKKRSEPLPHGQLGNWQPRLINGSAVLLLGLELPDPRASPSSPGSTRPQEPQEGLGSGFRQVWIPLFQVDELHGVMAWTLLGGGPLGPTPLRFGSEPTCPLWAMSSKGSVPWDRCPCSPRLLGHPAPRHFEAHLDLSPSSGAPAPAGVRPEELGPLASRMSSGVPRPQDSGKALAHRTSLLTYTDTIPFGSLGPAGLGRCGQAEGHHRAL